MGWSEEETLYADVNAIMVGFWGRTQFLRMMAQFNALAATGQPIAAGAPTSPARKGKPAQLTPQVFDAVFGVRAARRNKAGGLQPVRSRPSRLK